VDVETVKTEQRIIFTFPTTTDAMFLEHVCRTEDLPGRMIPVPTSISAGCGLSWSAPPEAREAISAAAEKNKIRIEGIYERVL